VFGDQVAMKLRFPAFDMIRYINVMNFIQNLEIVAILIWALSAFVKLSVYFFLASYGTAQLFKVKDWKKMIWFVAAVSLIMAIVFTNNSFYGYKNLRTYWIPFVLPVNIVGIPLLLWVVGSIRKKLGKQRQSQTNSQ
jgi:spore germination protein KB